MRYTNLYIDGRQVKDFRINMARRVGERMKGLLGTASLNDRHGLLIKPCSSIHTFFMSYPIDAVFIHASGRVLKICAAVKPWSGAACWSASAVLELAAGMSARIGIHVGAVLTFDPPEDMSGIAS